jgi:hypothetical protein
MFDINVFVEDTLSSYLGWPAWALKVIVVLICLVTFTAVMQYLFVAEPKNESGEKVKVKSVEFRWFQLQYLGVYLVIMVADWLQGTNMYTLYSVSYSFFLVFF